MTGRSLTAKERAHYQADGFCLEGPPLSDAKARRDRLALVRCLLKSWGADTTIARAALASHAVRPL